MVFDQLRRLVAGFRIASALVSQSLVRNARSVVETRVQVEQLAARIIRSWHDQGIDCAQGK